MTYDELVKEMKKHNLVVTDRAYDEAFPDTTDRRLRSARQSGAHAMRDACANFLTNTPYHSDCGAGTVLIEFANKIRSLEID